MQRSLLDILCCPVCRGDLTLLDAVGEADEVDAGILRCESCPADYAVENGIPNLLPPQGAGSDA